MALTSTQPALSTSQVELTGGAGPTLRQTVRLAILPSVDCFVGPTGVLTTTGFKVPANTTLRIELQYGERLFAIAAGAGTCYVLTSTF